MKICRFNDDRVGVVQADRVFDVTELVDDGAWMSVVAATARLSGAAFAACPEHNLAQVRLLAPVRAPGKIVAAPLNFAAHVREMQEAGLLAAHGSGDIEVMGLFLKAPSSVAGPSEGVRVRFPDRRTDHEVELVAVIGAAASDVPPERALDHVAGYCLGLDITLRGPEDRSFRKSIDSYSVLGPWLTTADEVGDPQALQLSLTHNGDLRQNSPTSDMVLTVAQLIAFASRYYTLLPGDVLFTGSPQGVGPIVAGDELYAECAGLGAMTVPVSAW